MIEPIESYRIWYSDGSYSDDWDAAPDEDVQIVMLYHADGYRTIIQGEDVYTDPTDQSGHIKTGRWMPDDEYEALVRRVLAS